MYFLCRRHACPITSSLNSQYSSLEPPGNKSNSGKVRLSNLKVTIDDQSIDGYYSPASDNVDNGLLVKYFMVCAHTPLLI